MKKKLRVLEIHPGKNGGHRVVHEFEPKAANRKGSMSGGMYMERPDSEEHNFGAGEQSKLLAHITEALKLTGEPDGDEE